MAFPCVTVGDRISLGHCLSCGGPKADRDVSCEMDFGNATVRVCVPCALELASRLVKECGKYRQPAEPLDRP